MAAKTRMAVGVNYPWVNYGFDFGLAPLSWRDSEPEPLWCRQLDAHLCFFQSLDITVVRWFILGDGLTYGSGKDAPRREATPAAAWRFDPVALDPQFLQHFSRLLSLFRDVNKDARIKIQLLPVFIDYLFCFPGNLAVTRPDPADSARKIADPGWVKQGRADVITDEDKRERFLDQVLDALLDASKAYRDVIYAWELINEPEWITNGWHPQRQSDLPVDESSMRAFLSEGKQRIRRAGFKPTIGFNRIETLLTSQITCEINQFHHYSGGKKKLSKHSFSQRYPAIIGEFATSTTDTWPELGKTGQTMLNRLELADALGYALAIPWSFRQKDRHSCWTQDVEEQIACFTESGRAGTSRLE